jgi:hypothetical protein
MRRVPYCCGGTSLQGDLRGVSLTSLSECPAPAARGLNRRENECRARRVFVGVVVVSLSTRSPALRPALRDCHVYGISRDEETRDISSDLACKLTDSHLATESWNESMVEIPWML